MKTQAAQPTNMTPENLPTEVPKKGLNKKSILDLMEDAKKADADWRHGKTWCLVYPAGDNHTEFLKKAHNMFFSENGLNPLAFQSLKKMEMSAIKMIGNLFHGGDEAVGTLTSGGTESLLLAVKTYRDMARKKRPWIRRPNIVLPRTVHAAVDKASSYFDVKLKFARTTGDYRADVKHMKKLIDRNTIALFASAPHYPQGVIDPISEIGALAQKKKLPLHIDACVGGFMLPWVERLGEKLPLWDFRVPGVTSISADLHKYGYAAKGASSIVYRSMNYFKYQFFAATDWPGGIYASATIPGTRPGGPMAAAWATLAALGEEGYLELTKKSLAIKTRIMDEIAGIPELEVMGNPHGTMLSFRCTESSGLDTYSLADRLEAKDWRFDRHQRPACIHLTCNQSNEVALEDFISDLKEAVAWVKKNPEVQGDAAMYGMMAKMPVRGVVKYSVLKLMESMYGPSGKIPDLANLGKDEDDPKLFQLMDKYGDKAKELLSRFKIG